LIKIEDKYSVTRRIKEKGEARRKPKERKRMVFPKLVSTTSHSTNALTERSHKKNRGEISLEERGEKKTGGGNGNVQELCIGFTFLLKTTQSYWQASLAKKRGKGKEKEFHGQYNFHAVGGRVTFSSFCGEWKKGKGTKRRDGGGPS